MIKFIDIEANNTEQAMSYYMQCLADGTWSTDKAHAVLQLQDDPDDLIAAIAEAQRAR